MNDTKGTLAASVRAGPRKVRAHSRVVDGLAAGNPAGLAQNIG